MLELRSRWCGSNGTLSSTEDGGGGPGIAWGIDCEAVVISDIGASWISGVHMTWSDSECVTN